MPPIVELISRMEKRNGEMLNHKGEEREGSMTTDYERDSSFV